MTKALNVLGTALEPCSTHPMTGFLRDGCCHAHSEDLGGHLICARVTADFLEFSKKRGNDLTTPQKAFGFEGLCPGDRWCLCALRFKEAYEASMAPKVILESTHELALDIVTLKQLQEHAWSN